MGTLVMVLGKSGSGKSTSLRNFGSDEVGVFNVAGKMMPFRSTLPTVDGPTYDLIRQTLAKNGKRAYVVDDATYLMAFDNFDKADTKGYDKFVTMAKSFYELLRSAMATSRDTVVYFLMHPELDATGNEKPRTIGKMLDEKLCIEGLFPVVLDCAAVPEAGGGVRHVFVARNDGTNLAKAPIGMFPDEPMDNDLKAVDTTIREFWGLAPITDGKEEANEG